MTQTHPRIIRDFIDRFLAATGRQDLTHDAVTVDSFGDSPQMADDLLALVLAGTKTATCSSVWAMEHAKSPPIEPGALWVICDGAGMPRCIIRTDRIEQVAYEDVTAAFARTEGEHEPLDLPDDEVLEKWRAGHWAYYIRELGEMGRTPTTEMPVLCEHFTVIYAEAPSN
ncbi:MAG: ASCH domain-containing protein [Phycisphaerae bacterium]|jgi:uncharacterized protein YhfF|nr:ASCH domain-containing protein [Phycisphaerae bacterium]|tara:strand:- start:444 stop:953 length:510 start_codon:yes stop_codon:yes gene_type:complete